MIVRFAACAAASCLALASASFAQPPAGPQVDPATEASPQSEPETVEAELSPEEMEAAVAEFHASLEHRTGRIALPSAHITLNVPAGFYFLDMADARSVLEEGWGNPPDANVSGMLFKEGMAALDDDAWGVVLTYEDTGYVSDEDANGIDYDVLIEAMREEGVSENAERKRQGYPTIDIIGWAAEPRYDAKTHKLYWAKELAFEGSPTHTLNYDMRVLGRRGVLSLNFVAAVEQLAEIEQVSPQVLAIPDFDAGSRYEDFNVATDTKADFGVAGLIGGTAAAAVIAKNTGFLAIVLLFLKKGWILVVGAVAGIGALVRNVFNRKPKAQEKAEQQSATAFFDAPADTPPPPAAPGGDDSTQPPSST